MSPDISGVFPGTALDLLHEILMRLWSSFRSTSRGKATKAVKTAIEPLETRRLFSVGSFYVKHDATSGYIDEWVNIPITDTPTHVVQLSSITEIYATGGSNGMAVTIDESAGGCLPVNGFGFNANSGAVSLNTVSIIGTSGNDSFSLASGNMSFGSTTVNTNGNVGTFFAINNGGTDSLKVQSGTVTIPQRAVGSGIGALNFSTLNVSSGASVDVLNPATNHSDRQVFVISSGGLVDSGTITLGHNDLIVKSGSWSSINGLVASGALSEPASGSPSTNLGVLPNNGGSGTTAIYSTFDGVSVSYGDILVKYTWVGDINLDGNVDGSDDTLIDNGYNNHLTGWYNGDINYDGRVDGSDYTLLDNWFSNPGPDSNLPA